MVKEQEDEIEEFETMKEDWLEMLDRLEKMSRKCEEDAKLETGQYLDNKTVKEVLGVMKMKDIEDWQEEVMECQGRSSWRVPPPRRMETWRRPWRMELESCRMSRMTDS